MTEQPTLACLARSWARGAALAALLLAAPPARAQDALPPVAGIWIDHTGRGAVEIIPCGEHLCGYIAWLKNPLAKNGNPLVDANNPDPRRRMQPICGTRVLSALNADRASAGRIWGDGRIYDPDTGESFDVEITLLSPNVLQVLGYAGVKFLGETFIWKRAPADIVRCGPPHD